MSLNDNAVLVLDTGNYFTAPVGTAFPLDLTNIPATWSSMGHSSLDEILAITSEGGDVTTLGTLQKKQLRTKTAPRIESLGITLHQFDAETLKLYFGDNMVDVGGGLLGVPSSPRPTVRAFLAVFVDGDATFAFYAPRAEIMRGDDPTLADTESLAALPISIKPMQHSTNAWSYAMLPLSESLAATGAIAGSPGGFTPAGSAIPANLAGMTGITADPATAWPTDTWVNLGDTSDAHWNGTAWVEGIAP